MSEIAEDKMGLDIGPETVASYAEALSKAGTIFWNGPMGVFEMEAFSSGTKGVAEAVARSEGYSVVGGRTPRPPSISLDLMMSHISTGGGASLAFVEGTPLPGIRVINEAEILMVAASSLLETGR